MLSFTQQAAAAGDEFAVMFEFCVQAGPQNYSLINNSNETAADLESKVWHLVDELRTHPVILGESFVLDYTQMKGIMKSSLIIPSLWPKFTTFLKMLLADDTSSSEIMSLVQNFAAINAEQKAADIITKSAPILGIIRGDNIPRAANFDEIEAATNEAHRAIAVVGEVWDISRFPCARWKMNVKERYERNFNVKTRDPVLMISNVYDGVTSLASAQNLSVSLEGSGFLTVNGYGVSLQISSSLNGQ